MVSLLTNVQHACAFVRKLYLQEIIIIIIIIVVMIVRDGKENGKAIETFRFCFARSAPSPKRSQATFLPGLSEI